MSTNLETRITRLEKTLRFYQITFSGIVLVAIAFLISSFADKNNAVPDKLVAKAFEVVDENGKVLVNLATYNGNGAITTFDKTGNYLVDVVSNTSGFGNINIYDGKGKPTLQLYNVKGGGGAMSIKNKDGQNALFLGLMSSGSGHISLNTITGSPLLWFGETSERNADFKLYNNGGKVIGRFAATNVSDGSIELSNSIGSRTIHITTDVSGKGSVTAFDNSGNKIGRLPQ